jgi:hypothetical protein
MEQRGIRSHLHLRPLGNTGNAFGSRSNHVVYILGTTGMFYLFLNLLLYMPALQRCVWDLLNFVFTHRGAFDVAHEGQINRRNEELPSVSRGCCQEPSMDVGQSTDPVNQSIKICIKSIRKSSPSCAGDQFFMADAPYVLSREDRLQFFQNMKNLQCPSGYVSNLPNRIMDEKIRGLKSHDYHIMLQHLLLVCLRNLGNAEVMGSIVRLSRLFHRLCAKVIDPGTEGQLMTNAAEVLVSLEKVFPPAFFDIMVHLTVHLVEELFLCGPVQTRWMYPYERYFKGLKSFVQNLAKPKGSMAQGYQVEEALGFLTEYMSTYTPTSRRVWDDQEDPTMVDEILEGKGRLRCLSSELQKWLHNFVCDNVNALEPYRE